MDKGVPASPSGCQPSASAAEEASSRSGIPNAACNRYADAVAVVEAERGPSCSTISKRLGIGYNEAARYMERMEAEGVVSAPNSIGQRRMERALCGNCEGCGAPLFADDVFVWDDHGIQGCWALFTDAADKPCYAHRVGKEDANAASVDRSPEGQDAEERLDRNDESAGARQRRRPKGIAMTNIGVSVPEERVRVLLSSNDAMNALRLVYRIGVNDGMRDAIGKQREGEEHAIEQGMAFLRLVFGIQGHSS